MEEQILNFVWNLETYEMFNKVYSDDCLVLSKVQKWFKRFQNGRENFEW